VAKKEAFFGSQLFSSQSTLLDWLEKSRHPKKGRFFFVLVNCVTIPLMLNVNQGFCEYSFLIVCLTGRGNEPSPQTAKQTLHQHT